MARPMLRCVNTDQDSKKELLCLISHKPMVYVIDVADIVCRLQYVRHSGKHQCSVAEFS